MNLIAKKPVHIGGGWVPAGQPVPYDVAGFDYEAAACRGLIESEDGDEIVNPGGTAPATEPLPLPDSSAEVRAEADRLTADLASIKVLFPDAGSTADVVAAVKRLQAEHGKKDKAHAAELTRLQTELEQAQANAAKPDDVAALAEYRDVVGELLPQDFPSRKILLEHGYYTVETVQAATDEELTALDGIAEGKKDAIRERAPYTEAAGE